MLYKSMFNFKVVLGSLGRPGSRIQKRSGWGHAKKR